MHACRAAQDVVDREIFRLEKGEYYGVGELRVEMTAQQGGSCIVFTDVEAAIRTHRAPACLPTESIVGAIRVSVAAPVCC